MATAKKISALTAVVTPAGSDVLAVKQGSTTKKLTVTQLLTLQDAAIATITQAAAEAGTATDRRIFTAQRVKQAIDALAGGGTAWEQVVGADTIAAGEAFAIEDGGSTFTITLATTIAANEEFIIHNNSTSTGVVSFEPNTGHTVNGPGGAAVGDTDTIVLAPGDTLHLLAISSSILEII